MEDTKKEFPRCSPGPFFRRGTVRDNIGCFRPQMVPITLEDTNLGWKVHIQVYP